MKSTQPFSIQLLLILCSASTIYGELFTSVEELTSKWTPLRLQLVSQLDHHIRNGELAITKMQNVQKLVQATIHSDNYSPQAMSNPVGAFVLVNRFVRPLNELEVFLDEYEIHELRQALDSIRDKYDLPTADDVVGLGEALLRLQTFYDLNIEDIASGCVTRGSFHGHADCKQSTISMDAQDCFEVGKIAYNREDFASALVWLRKSLELMDKRRAEIEEAKHVNGKNNFADSSSAKQDMINEILDYQAFASYKLGLYEDAAEYTRLWLARDPGSERAKNNLEYYESELAANQTNAKSTLSRPKETVESLPDQQPKRIETYELGEKFSPLNYEVTEDSVVRALCRSPGNLVSADNLICSRLVHFSKYPFLPESYIETLSLDPRIVRIHNFVTEKEAEHLRQMALPRLKRSTVQTSSGLATTNFRIAKTAWLSKYADATVERIENRVSELLGFNLEESEDLQLVNYGLGGFYGPHLDAARESSADTLNRSLEIGGLKSNDRLATVLIYLNHVDAGGSTVFPKLGLNVEPIERSVVMWMNIRPNGLADNRTLHTGCPVLLGSKWIATKWPRERANMFRRPCGLRPED